LVRAGLRDVLVEPRRAGLIAGFAAARDAALAAGAMGASISGAGPSVFAWFEQREAAFAAQSAVQQAFADAGFDSQGWVSPLNAPAARLL
jgi:homoserine kinase